jgi:hypothetical protein
MEGSGPRLCGNSLWTPDAALTEAGLKIDLGRVELRDGFAVVDASVDATSAYTSACSNETLGVGTGVGFILCLESRGLEERRDYDTSVVAWYYGSQNATLPAAYGLLSL